MLKNVFLCILFLLLITFSCYFLNAETVQSIGLTIGDYTPEVVSLSDVTVNRAQMFDNKYFKLIQFEDIPSDNDKRSWKQNGLYLTDYLPVNTFFAVIDEGFQLNELANSGVNTIIDVHDLFKMESKLASLRMNNRSVRDLVVSYYESLDPYRIMDDLRSRGVFIENHRDYSRQLDITIDPSRLDEIVALPYIQFIGAQPGEPELESYYSNSTGRANYLNTGYNGLNYNGTGVTIAIGEGGTVDNHIDFRGRLTEMVSGSLSNHKIGVMLYAGGSGNEDPTEKNNAHGATLLSVDWYPDYATLYTSHNLRFTNLWNRS